MGNVFDRATNDHLSSWRQVHPSFGSNLQRIGFVGCSRFGGKCFDRQEGQMVEVSISQTFRRIWYPGCGVAPWNTPHQAQ
ncbi:MAG: hypothetical protein C0616_14700 [Desulfuromonas sp.]|nr:MAG: hypothetical protein C0616_14700 [Desulfuromonas sp.]